MTDRCYSDPVTTVFSFIVGQVFIPSSRLGRVRKQRKGSFGSTLNMAPYSEGRAFPSRGVFLLAYGLERRVREGDKGVCA